MDTAFLSQTLFFRGIPPKELETVLECLCAQEKGFPKGAVVYHAGEMVEALGLVLRGRVQVESDDYWGNKSVLDSAGPGMVFAEAYACIPGQPLMVSVVAAMDSRILFLNVNRILQTCGKGCAHHREIIRNLLALSAQKNLALSRRIFHTSPKSIRGRLLSYLSFQAAHCESKGFTIPYNRQQLADYLNVDRSALSNELGKMRREGLIDFEKDRFTIKGGAL